MSENQQKVYVEKTSKKLKSMKVKSYTLFYGGFIIIFVGSNSESVGLCTFGLLSILAGMIMYVVTKVKTWWHHG